MEETKTVEQNSNLESGVEEDIADWVDASRQNERVGVALITGIHEGPDGRVAVRFDLPHGDQYFTQVFRVGGAGKKTVKRLLRTAGLDPAVDSVRDLDGREVPVERRRAGWRVDLDEADQISMNDEVLDRAGALARYIGLFGLFWSGLMMVAMVVGGLTPMAGVPFFLTGVVLRVLGEGAFLNLREQTELLSPNKVKRYRQYLGDNPSLLGLLFHLFTGGHLID